MTNKVLTTVVVLAIGLVPIGLVLGFYYNQPGWFLMSVLATILLAAG